MKFLFVLLLIPLGIVQAAPKGLDVNDVSYIFPLDALGRPFPDIPLTEGLLSKDLFIQVLAMGEGHTTSEKLQVIRRNFLFRGDVVTDFSKWRVTSFRYNHCGDASAMEGAVLVQTGGPCSAYLRVVAQPISRAPIDSALHLLYKLGPEPTDDNLILQKLLNLRDDAEKLGISTAKLPLQIHPGLVLALQQPRSQFEKKVANFIRDVLGPSPTSKLDMITMTATTNTKQWKFFGGIVENDSSSKNLRWTGFNTPIFQSLKEFTPQSLVCDGSSLCKATPEVPTSNAPVAVATFPSLFELFREKKAEQFNPSIRFQEIAEIIDNPKKVNLFNTDCMSCHETSSIRSKSALLTADQGFPLGITPFVKSRFIKGDATSIINFGYQDSSPRISVRTAAESAVVADAVNRILQTTNPGFICRQEKQSSLWDCLIDPSTGRDFMACYQQFCE